MPGRAYRGGNKKNINTTAMNIEKAFKVAERGACLLVLFALAFGLGYSITITGINFGTIILLVMTGLTGRAVDESFKD